jgi:transglutaminase-like putative cysteine protease
MTRQLNFGLLLIVLMVTAPHALHLPGWVITLCASLLLWRGYLTYRNEPVPKRWLILLVTLFITGAILIEYHSLFGREVGVTMLMLLAALKLLELKTPRDAMVLIYLSCFIIITNFLYSQSMITGVYLFATLLVIMLVWVHLYAPGSTLTVRLKIALTLLLQAIPLTLILFVLFPRFQGPLWGLPQDAFARSGLDNTMTPGSLSHLALSDTVAFRVTYQGTTPRHDQMYWRGPVLWHYDGRIWTTGKVANVIRPKFSDARHKIEYSVTLEPDNKNWLFALDVPVKISTQAKITDDFQLLSPEPVNTRLRYEANSYLEYHANIEESAGQLARALQLPPNSNLRARQLGESWHYFTDVQIVNRALTYFHEQNFSYTLDPAPLGFNEIDDFLFKTKQGFCEHYASSFVFLMRAAGIPARVVTGYQGGEYNAYGKYYIVRQSDAHAWAEVWIKTRGWVRIDPTAAISPERVSQGISAALPDNANLPFMEQRAPKWLRSFRLNLDAITYQWNTWVIGYNYERQFALLSNFGFDSWRSQIVSMLTGLALLIALFSLYMLRHLFKREHDKTQAAWLKLCRKLAKSGLLRLTHEGPRDFSVRVMQARPDLALAMQDLTSSYIALRYGAPGDENSLREFIRRVDQLTFSK